MSCSLQTQDKNGNADLFCSEPSTFVFAEDGETQKSRLPLGEVLEVPSDRGRILRVDREKARVWSNGVQGR